MTVISAERFAPSLVRISASFCRSSPQLKNDKDIDNNNSMVVHPRNNVELTGTQRFSNGISGNSSNSSTSTSSTISCNVVRKQHKKSMEKRVQFAASSTSKQAEVIIEPSYELTDDICDNVWWSSREQEENGFERNQIAQQFRQKFSATARNSSRASKTRTATATAETSAFNGSDEGCCCCGIDEQFVELYKHCSIATGVSQVLRSQVGKNILVEISKTEGLRGLESKFIKTMAAYRRKHVHSILLATRGESPFLLLNNTNNNDCQQQQQQQQQQPQSSRASEILARTVALLDAREAASC